MNTDREIIRWARALNEAFGEETLVRVPPYGGDPEEFGKVVDSAFGRDFYAEFVPDEYEEKYCDRLMGRTIDDDDWNIYRVNHRSTLSRRDFWDRVLDETWDEFGDEGVEVRAGELRGCVEKAAAKAAHDAWNEYRPGDDELVHRIGDPTTRRRCW